MRRIRLRYDSVCAVCHRHLPPGTEVDWYADRRSAVCVACVADERAAVVSGAAGGSARAEAARRRERQRANHEQIKERHPILGRLALGLDPDPDAGQTWATGADGEERLAGVLAAIPNETALVLHDRRMPKSKANIDHLVVSPTGVWVIDCKYCRGKLVEKRDVGGWRHTDVRLFVGGRDRSKLVAGVRQQVEHVERALAASMGPAPTVQGALCFVGADWRLFARRLCIDGVQVSDFKVLRARLTDEGPVDADQRTAIQRLLAVFPPPAP